MIRRAINVVFGVAAMVFAVGFCAEAQSAAAAHVSVSAPPSPVMAALTASHPRMIVAVAAIAPAAHLVEEPSPASLARSFSVSGTAAATTPMFSASRASGGFYYPDTQVLYTNYADEARAEFEALSASANRAAFGDGAGLTYTLRNSHVLAAFSMGGGDVQMSQPSLYSLTRAAAVAEAGVDLSTPDHRFGLRVQGRAIVNQPLVVALPVVHVINVLTPEYPSLMAYIHF
jgi:hypothetical protein